jgi:hypothetical protein
VSAQEKTQQRALDRGGEAQGNGANLLISAESAGKEITADSG